MLAGMTGQSTQTNPGAPAAPPASSSSAPPAPGQQAPDFPQRDVGGLVLDIAGVLAAGVLVVIIVDVWTEGKLSGWWRNRRAGVVSAPDPSQE